MILQLFLTVFLAIFSNQTTTSNQATDIQGVEFQDGITLKELSLIDAFESMKRDFIKDEERAYFQKKFGPFLKTDAQEKNQLAKFNESDCVIQ